MPHSWKAYTIAEVIGNQLLEGRLISKKDLLKVRGIIQIILEDKYYHLIKDKKKYPCYFPDSEEFKNCKSLMNDGQCWKQIVEASYRDLDENERIKCKK